MLVYRAKRPGGHPLPGHGRKEWLPCVELRCGHASKGDMAAIVYEKVQARPWTATTRLKAAESLARLHRIAISEVGDELAGLVRSSAPNRDLEESASNWRTEYRGLAGEIDVGEEEAAEVVAAYSRLAPVDREVVSWHRRCWRAFWKLRELRERGVAEA